MKAVDLFCGAGGTSLGAEQAGAELIFAVNHWIVAVRTHFSNFPNARHANARLEHVPPGESPRMDLLLASPECTGHSRARGGMPTGDQQRAGANEVLKWLAYHKPEFAVIENVPEFRKWGPCGKRGRPLKRGLGKFFNKWIMDLRAEGYRVEIGELNAMNFGAATSRERLFVIASKSKPIRWPTPTHTSDGPTRWRTAADVLHWRRDCTSVFGRPQPMADATLQRVQTGITRRPLMPLVMSYYGNGSTFPTTQPLGTLTTHDRFALLTQHAGTSTITARSAAEQSLLDVMAMHGIADIGLRMLSREEQAEAQGFTPDYQFHGSGAEITKQIGNSVSPPVARAIVAEILAS